MINFTDKFFKLFRIVAIDNYIFLWDFYLPILLKSFKFSCDEIIARIINVCVCDDEEYVPGIEVLIHLTD